MDAEQRLDRPLVPGLNSALTPAQIGRILRARWRLIAAVTGTFLLLAVLAALLKPDSYTASASVLLDFQTNDAVTGQSLSANLAASQVATRIDLLRSKKVRLGVVERLGMTENPEARKAFEASDEDSFKDWLAGRLGESFNLRTDELSRIVHVRYTAEDPRRAAEIANAFVEAYRDIDARMAAEAARARQERFREYLAGLREDVEQAQRRLTEAQQESDVIDIREDGQPDTERLQDLNLKLNELQARRDAALARLRRLRELRDDGGGLAAQAEIPDDRHIQELRSRLAQLEAQRADRQETLGPRHPGMTSMDAQIDSVRRQLREALDAYVRAVRGETRSAAEKIAALEETIAAERRDLMDIQAKRDRVARYVRELKVAEQLYQTALNRYDNIQGASELRESGLSVISAATPPLHPEGLPGKLLVLIGLAAGLIVGTASALLAEFADRRVRGGEDLTGELGLPLLGELPKP